MSAKGRLEIQCLHVSRIIGTIDTFPAGLLCQYLRKYCKFSTKPLLGLSNKRSRPVVRFFLLEGATLWPNEAGGITLGGGGRGGGMLGCLRLHHHCFEKHGYFWSLGIAQSFKLQKWFFFSKRVQSTPFIADTVRTSSYCPLYQESIIAGLYFSQTSVICLFQGSVLSWCPQGNFGERQRQFHYLERK